MSHKFTTIAAIESVLLRHVDLSQKMRGKGMTVERTKRLAAHVGNPHNNLKVVHVAGTSGKTSTSYYISALLKQSGVSVGMTVSPHIDSIVERVQVNGSPLDEKLFCLYFEEFYVLVESFDDTPTYFELMMVFAYWVFAKLDLEYAVVETGLGGLHDSSNIASKADKVCVITDIGYDHVHVLGDTLEEITAQKIGIVQKSNHVFMYRQSDEILRIVQNYVKDQRGTLNIHEENVDHDYSERNFQLALCVAEYVYQRDSLGRIDNKILEQIRRTYIPGRMEVVKLADRTVVFDGAHNEQKMSAFAASFLKRFGTVRPVVVIALKEGKDFTAVVPLVESFAGKIIVTTFNTSQDQLLEAMDPKVLASTFQLVGSEVSVIENPALAMKHALTTGGQLVVVTGSFYLIGELHHYALTFNETSV